MEKLTKNLQENLQEIKKRLPATDILTYSFSSAIGAKFAIIYADGVVNKEFLGELVAKPLSLLPNKQPDFSAVQAALLFPELKQETNFETVQKEILDGNSALFIDGVNACVIVGAKQPPSRAVVEPPTSVTVKGPREGFVEDIKINMGLVRKRLKTPNLQFKMLNAGKQSNSHIAICFLKGIANEQVVDELEEKIQQINEDIILDSSYIADEISPRKHSAFPQVGTTEKPDIFSAKLSEGRVGILVDGSPVALTVPFLLVEDFQAPDDYFTSPFSATVIRLLRFFAVLAALLLPAFYVASQLFKLQLLPLNLTLTIASSIQGIPLSPSLEMFLVLFVLEVIKEASIRMPKYVGMALSVVGALVLGETAVSAGFVSTPAIIIVAFSGLCLYTVPEFTETGTLLRWLILIAAGSFGAFGIVATVAFLLYYLVSVEAFGAPLLCPFAPLVPSDTKDTIVKFNDERLTKRPFVFRSKNKTRKRIKKEV